MWPADGRRRSAISRLQLDEVPDHNWTAWLIGNRKKKPGRASCEAGQGEGTSFLEADVHPARTRSPRRRYPACPQAWIGETMGRTAEREAGVAAPVPVLIVVVTMSPAGLVGRCRRWGERDKAKRNRCRDSEDEGAQHDFSPVRSGSFSEHARTGCVRTTWFMLHNVASTA